MKPEQELKKRIEKQVNRMKKSQHDRPKSLSETLYLGTLVLVLLTPIIAGAYLGHWLDERTPGYSVHWTLSSLLIGIVIGIFNVYFLTKD